MEQVQVGEGYRDGKRYWWWLSVLWPLTPLPVIYVALRYDISLLYWYLVFAFYLVLPLVDHGFGTDSNNPPESAVPALERDHYYRRLTYLTVVAHFIGMFYLVDIVGSHDLAWHQVLGLTLSLGLMNALAMNTAHELGHKGTGLERWLARLTLALAAYGHFYVEHNRGHHRDVATPDDCASARMGETIYRFARREMVGGWRRAWQLEAARLRATRRAVWSWRNEFLQPWAITVVLYGLLLAHYGVVVLPMLLGQAAVAWWMLTTANYVEHYGLLRRRRPDGHYEPCRPEHSWNSNQIVSNLLLFHLQRHSDHHSHPRRSYQSLRSFPDLPELPAGYPLMFGVSLFPPLWFRLMDPRLLAHYGGDIRRTNLDPVRGPALAARYGG